LHTRQFARPERAENRIYEEQKPAHANNRTDFRCRPSKLLLTSRAEVSAAASDYDALDGGLAGPAGLAGTGVDAVVKLEETGNTVGVNVIRDGGATELDGLFENLLQGGAQVGEFVAREASGVAAGADAGVVQGLVGVDVADAVEKGLVEKRSLDRGLAASK